MPGSHAQADPASRSQAPAAEISAWPAVAPSGPAPDSASIHLSMMLSLSDVKQCMHEGGACGCACADNLPLCKMRPVSGSAGGEHAGHDWASIMHGLSLLTGPDTSEMHHQAAHRMGGWQLQCLQFGARWAVDPQGVSWHCKQGHTKSLTSEEELARRACKMSLLEVSSSLS